MKELSSDDICKYFRGSPDFGNVINKDDLSKLKSKVYIANLDTPSGPGTHWVMVSNLDPYCFYFDSFGIDPRYTY